MGNIKKAISFKMLSLITIITLIAIISGCTSEDGDKYARLHWDVIENSCMVSTEVSIIGKKDRSDDINVKIGKEGGKVVLKCANCSDLPMRVYSMSKSSEIYEYSVDGLKIESLKDNLVLTFPDRETNVPDQTLEIVITPFLCSQTTLTINM